MQMRRQDNVNKIQRFLLQHLGVIAVDAGRWVVRFGPLLACFGTGADGRKFNAGRFLNGSSMVRSPSSIAHETTSNGIRV
jgi:hypothetical protein